MAVAIPSWSLTNLQPFATPFGWQTKPVTSFRLLVLMLSPRPPRGTHTGRLVSGVPITCSSFVTITALHGLTASLRQHGAAPRRCRRIEREPLGLPHQDRSRPLRSWFAERFPLPYQPPIPAPRIQTQRRWQLLDGRAASVFFQSRDSHDAILTPGRQMVLTVGP
jgi:hypothetical protein